MPLEAVEAFFEHGPQVLGAWSALIAMIIPLTILICITRCCWIHRKKICPRAPKPTKRRREEENEGENETTANQKRTQKPRTPSAPTNEERYRMIPNFIPNLSPGLPRPTSTSILNAPQIRQLVPGPNSKHRPRTDWPDEFTRTISTTRDAKPISWNKFDDGRWRKRQEGGNQDFTEAPSYINEWLDDTQAKNAREDGNVMTNFVTKM
jgi:hypothetical protein